jgi:hypothetical protein
MNQTNKAFPLQLPNSKNSIHKEPSRLLLGGNNLTRVVFALNKERRQRYQRQEKEAKTQIMIPLIKFCSPPASPMLRPHHSLFSFLLLFIYIYT